MTTTEYRLLFTSSSERIEYEQYAHPKLKEELERFVAFSKAHSLPLPVVTCAGRTPAENSRTPGSVVNSDHLLDPANGDESFEAVDLRVRHYSPEELKRVVVYWRTRQELGEAYFVSNLNHGTGPHLHVGIRLAALGVRTVNLEGSTNAG
jgi:hypothetical protein